MSRQVQTNLLYTDPNTGAVHAVFPGGVDILANQSSFSVQNHVAWREDLPSGAMVAEIAGYKGAGSFPNSGVILSTPDTAHTGNNSASLRIDNGGSTPGQGAIYTTAEGWIDTLLRGDGFSGYKYQNIANTGVIGGPTFPSTGVTVLAGVYNFTLGSPQRILATFNGLVQHNGVAGVTYTVYGLIVIDGVSYYVGGFTGNNNGWDAPMSGAVVSQQLNAGAHTVYFGAYESASPTFGYYDWTFTAGVLPLSFPDNVHT